MSKVDKLNCLLELIEAAKNEETIRGDLVRLDELIRSDQEIRESLLTDRFYSVILERMQSVYYYNNCDWSLAYLLVKCLKNSAAAFKSSFSEQERAACLFVNKILRENVSNELVFCVDKTNDDKQVEVFRLLFNYVFNLVQGNKNAYELFMNEWTETCIQILSLHHQNIRPDLFNLLSMITFYGCVEKTNKDSSSSSDYLMSLLDKHFSHMTYMSYLNLVASSSSSDDKLQHWSIRFVDFYFVKFYFDRLLAAPSPITLINDFDTQSRINLVGYLSDTLSDLFKTQSSILLLGESNLGLLMHLFIESCQDFVISTTDQDTRHLLFSLLKLVANCLSDILTMPADLTSVDENLTRSSIRFVQSNEEFFSTVCTLFKLIHSDTGDDDIVASFLNSESSKSIRVNLKCDLVRLIGILVYEHGANQNKLVDNDLLTIISSSFSIDTENPFLREWSILALKHILSCLDSK